MSTKIFNGHEIVGHTLDSFLPVLRSLQEQLRTLAHRQAVRVITRLAVALHDRHTLGLEVAKEQNFLMAAEFEVMRRQKEVDATKRRDPTVDFEFTVCLFPVEGRLLATTYVEQRELKQLWDVQTWRREFGYWDNTDPPEELAEAEWDERARLWGLVFPGYDAPSEVGYSFTLLPMDGHFLFANNEEVAAHLPTLEERAQAMSIPWLLHRRKAEGQPESKTMSEFRALQASPEAEEALREVTAKLAPHLSAQRLRGESTGPVG